MQGAILPVNSCPVAVSRKRSIMNDLPAFSEALPLSADSASRSQLVSRIDPVTLKLFIAVVEEASIARAAGREHITPSAVSKRLADLERIMHVPLLERHRRGVRPSKAGEALLRHSRRMLHDLEQLEVEMDEFAMPTHTARGLAVHCHR